MYQDRIRKFPDYYCIKDQQCAEQAKLLRIMWHTIKPGTPEHITPAERGNNETLEHGTMKHQRNSRNTTEQGWNTGITVEYRNNGTPQKLEPKDRHDIFH